MHDIAYMWNLNKKNGTSEPIYKTQVRVTGMETKLVVTQWGEGRRGKLGGWDFVNGFFHLA